MRARDLNINNLPPLPAFAQPKLNGIRAKWDGAALRTRNGRKITGLPHIVKDCKKIELAEFCPDGEIYAAGVDFEEINGLVRRKKPCAKSAMLQFHVFDFAVNDVPQDVRLEMVADVRETAAIRRVHHITVHSEAELLRAYSGYLSGGDEGLILRDMDALYSPGLGHSALWRLKPDDEFEAQVVDYMINVQTGTIDTLILAMQNSCQFKICPVPLYISMQILDNPLGAKITILCNGFTRAGLPRHGRIKAVRYDI